ncbi:MAG: hypothetical protein ABIP90_03635, partial [Vicinamibacterales bacterium]
MTEAETQPGVPPPVPRRRSSAFRWSRRGLLVLAAVIAALLFSLLTIDLGPSLRERAEREATNYFERPVHIGGLSATLRSGVFVARNVRIEGLTPDAAPFLKADEIRLHIPLSTLARRDLVVEATMDGWALTMEMFPGNKSNIPRLRPRSTEPGKFQTNISYIWARGGWFRLIDHAQPLDLTAENVAVNFTRDLSLDKYVATVAFRGGVTNILSYAPMRLDSMTARLSFDTGNFISVQGLDLVADGTRSHMTGVLNLNKWPEQYFNISTAFDVAPLKEIFFFGQAFKATGRGEYKGKFQKLQSGKYDLTGVLKVPGLNVSGFDFPEFDSRVVWMQNRLELVGAHSKFYGGDLNLTYVLTALAGPGGSLADLSARYKGVDLTTFGRVMNWQGIELASRADGWQTMTWPGGRFDSMVGDGEIRAATVDGRAVAAPELVAFVSDPARDKPFDRPMDAVPVSGRVTYRLTPTAISIQDGWAATPETHLSFHGTTG